MSEVYLHVVIVYVGGGVSAASTTTTARCTCSFANCAHSMAYVGFLTTPKLLIGMQFDDFGPRVWHGCMVEYYVVDWRKLCTQSGGGG